VTLVKLTDLQPFTLGSTQLVPT